MRARTATVIAVATMLAGCASILGIPDVTLEDGGADAIAPEAGPDVTPDVPVADVASDTIAIDSPATTCAPSTSRACGTSGTQTCGPSGTWCNCIGDAPQTCTGTGTFTGCRGDGCYVCQEKLTAYACYLKNHPNCALNTTCAGQFFACSAQCPAPTAEDACSCVAAANGWSDCDNTACSVCTDQTAAYACYFINHPTCLAENNCPSTRTACSQYCPAPTPEDKGFTADGGLAP